MKPLGIFWRGLLMGGADIIPGVSGGTMAFITGIYDRFIEALRTLTDTPRTIINDRSLRPLLTQDWRLLIPLGLGIAIAFGIGSAVLPPLLKAYPALVYAFFVGLILASAAVIFGHIPEHSARSWAALILGLVLGALIGILSPGGTMAPSMWHILLAGFIGITAMLLPGISGSYILLIMGVYTYMLESVHHITHRYPSVIVFIIGAIFGLAALSHVLSWLLHNKRAYTLAALVGIMVGSLMSPLRIVVENADGTGVWMGAAALAILGAALVIILERMTHRVGRPVQQ